MRFLLFLGFSVLLTFCNLTLEVSLRRDALPIPDDTPTAEWWTLTPTPTEVVTFPTPRPFVLMVNTSDDRWRLRQCPSTTCPHIGWVFAGEVVEVDAFASTDDWLQVFRSGEIAGWVSAQPFEDYTG